jgi:L-iditol 2-dehydrogenase
VDACGVCGTDLHILAGEHKNWPPVVLGHEYTGRIAQLGPADDSGGSENWAVGDRVVCEQHTLACGRCFSCRTGAIHLCPHKRSPGWGIDGAFADAVALPAHLLHRVPDAVSARAAAVTEPTAICLTALDRAALRGGESVVVVGPGPVGLLCALLARAQGAGSVLLVGRSSSAARLALAASLGLTTATSDEVDVAALVADSTAGRGADVVLETSGSEQGLDQAIRWTRRAGRVVCVGISGRPTVAVAVDEAMSRSLTVAFSMSSEYSTWDRALALMATGALDPVPLTTVYDLGDWEQAFADIEARRVVKALLTPRPLPA